MDWNDAKAKKKNQFSKEKGADKNREKKGRKLEFPKIKITKPDTNSNSVNARPSYESSELDSQEGSPFVIKPRNV